MYPYKKIKCNKMLFTDYHIYCIGGQKELLEDTQLIFRINGPCMIPVAGVPYKLSKY
jgi:hypothetical protein